MAHRDLLFYINKPSVTCSYNDQNESSSYSIHHLCLLTGQKVCKYSTTVSKVNHEATLEANWVDWSLEFRRERITANGI